MRNILFFLSTSLPLVLWSCNGKQETPKKEVFKPGRAELVELKYAEGFTITNDSIYTIIEIKRPFQGATSGFKYLLVPKNAAIPGHGNDMRVIKTPVNSIACTSTTHIPLLDYLNQTDKLVGFPTTDYISSPKMRRRVDEGKVIDLGVDKGINIELLSSLKPELLMGYTMTAEYGQFKKIEELGVPVVMNAEYLEKHPLGRAEWLKFMAQFFDEEKRADSVFASIEANYLATKRVVSEDTTKSPTALSGIMYGDTWFLPGGKNYAATILADAGYQYLWSDDPSNGFLELSFETVLSRAHNSDFWIGVGAFQSLKEMSAADHRYAQFDAFKKKRVYSYDARKGAKGGNEYLELGYLRPDLILKDLLKISRPEKMKDYDLYFHRQLP
jgi:iron complex transport system substrate-binding protein